ncbi:hypothetical protein CROQUDRAFT_86156 [Cronartium quercuum f. sp. fusiforme G11]|uniref:CxC1-like cysteine cluster associated with KDZ transposases domain-containing protein n=1 Tax=Cronartium quercuum f. sp. fusiforme G11 TaxID=708437 RepID=A0A9P6THP0_9BASI|nr:hypothetical protein CROQUDRAFT_86156 [Cronartium quercuum f. sp. fusiforme G11]
MAGKHQFTFSNNLYSRKSKHTRQQPNPSPPALTPAQAIANETALGYHGPQSQGLPQHQPLVCHDDEDQWVTDTGIPQDEIPSTPAIPTAASQLAKAGRSKQNADKRKRIQEEWQQLDHQLTAAFLLYQNKTVNWMSDGCMNVEDFHCQRNGHQITSIQVDLIDILGYNSNKLIKFCDCMPKAVQLLHHGYFPSSPQKPQTAFSIQLIQFHHELWNTSIISTTSFVTALMAYLRT